jgi:hypothetical protein
MNNISSLRLAVPEKPAKEPSMNTPDSVTAGRKSETSLRLMVNRSSSLKNACVERTDASQTASTAL